MELGAWGGDCQNVGDGAVNSERGWCGKDISPVHALIGKSACFCALRVYCRNGMGRHSFVFMRHVSLLNGIAFQVGHICHPLGVQPHASGAN